MHARHGNAFTCSMVASESALDVLHGCCQRHGFYYVASEAWIGTSGCTNDVVDGDRIGKTFLKMKRDAIKGGMTHEGLIDVTTSTT